MKRTFLTTLLTSLVLLIAVMCYKNVFWKDTAPKDIKVGFIFIGDASTAYTYNYIRAEQALEEKYGDSVEITVKYNVPEGGEEEALQQLIDEKCNIIFGTSYGYKDVFKEYAKKNPKIQFCMATADNANTEPVLSNYHTFMGEIYEGRYICGVVAGMKIRELIESGRITEDQALVGYVGALPYAEVISGYTAFYLGVNSVVPEAKMLVKYTNTWSDYTLEKQMAEELIQEGCVVISQHSDTEGPAVACEQTEATNKTYCISYNQSMTDVAPTAALTGCRINWAPYILSAVEAVRSGKEIESLVEGHRNGNDIGAGFELDWVQMLELNYISTAENTQETVDKIIDDFKNGSVHVFKGDFTGVNPFDESDTVDLNTEYIENKNSSAPTFKYVLKDVITVE